MNKCLSNCEFPALLRKEWFRFGGPIDSVALIFSPTNRFYFTGFSSSNGLVAFTNRGNYLFLDPRYCDAAKKSVKGFKIVCFKNLDESLEELVKWTGSKSAVIEKDYVNLSFAEKLEDICLKDNCYLDKNINLSSILCNLRSIKSLAELDKIKESQRITEKGFEHVLKYIKPGRTELELANEIESFVKKLGAKSVAFDLIVASGINSSVPHHFTGNRKIGKNDIILIDMGVNFDGYMSDMSRTVFIGQPTAEQKDVYNTVLEAQELAISNIKPGVNCCEIDKIARVFIDNSKYAGCFLHSIGHGVGLEIHEKPFLSKKSGDVLKPGMVVTVEPGIYLSGKLGVRIEDMILITENGHENLTSATKDVIVL